jgi:hypothetical protein
LTFVTTVNISSMFAFSAAIEAVATRFLGIHGGISFRQNYSRKL